MIMIYVMCVKNPKLKDFQDSINDNSALAAEGCDILIWISFV